MPAQQFRYFRLPGVLPEGHVLVLNTHPYSLSTFVLTQLSAEVHGLVAQEVVTELEMYVLVALLEAYPHYCPYEVLQADMHVQALFHAPATVHRAAQRIGLAPAREPVRITLSGGPAKLNKCGIEMRSSHGRGY